MRIPSFLLLLSAAAPCNAQTRPPEIQEEVLLTGRYAHFDNNKDGWDDLWQHLFPDVDFTKPDLDEDHDGKTNYEEMLDFTHPQRRNAPVRELTPEEIKSAREASAKAGRASDAKKIARFHALLEARGALVRGTDAPPLETKEQQEAVPAGDAPGETGEESSFHDGGRPLLMLCDGGDGAPAKPKIIALERLSTGHCLLAWEGRQDRVFRVEWSDDLLVWRQEAHDFPVLGGVGTWGGFTLASKRFYRVVENEDIITLPSDPSGGNGTTTFGATLTPQMYDGAPNSYLIHVNLPSGIPAVSVDLFIDGEMHSRCTPTASADVFVGQVRKWSLLEGGHTVHAVVDTISETTAVLAEDAIPTAGILMSPVSSFTLARRHEAVGFRASETMIAPDDPTLPTYTEIAVDIPYDPQGSGQVNIRDEDGNIVRHWEWGLDDYPQEFREAWDGTDDSGSPVPGGSYGVQLDFGGAGFGGGSIQIAAGQRPWEALCLTESLGGWGGAADFTNFRPPWAPHYTSSGGVPVANAWGPWKFLESTSRLVDEFRGRVKNVFGLGNTGKWKIRFWQSGSKNSDSIANPVAAFAAGGNPFNNYDLGVFVGHGVACAGGNVDLPGGATMIRQPQHYYPLMLDRATGAAHWVGSASIPKYGAAGSKLKWMFLVTCNSFLDNGAHNIYTPCKASDTLPFGDGLRVLCGYKTKIEVEGRIGGLLSDALIHQVNGQDFRDGTVVNAWGHVWNMSANKGFGFIARAVYWEECADDRIHGAKPQSHIPPLQPHASQADLEERDFTP